MTPTVALTIAGSDSGGGAGVQADLRTFAAHGVHGTCAITAVTAQNTRAVLAVRALDPELVLAQIAAVRDDMEVAATKTGMLATPATVAALGEVVGRPGFPPVVVDPVLVSSTGSALMEKGGVDAYWDLLLPYATVATPNLREAAMLTGRDVGELTSVAAMRQVALDLRGLGASTVVVKGGHLAATRAQASAGGATGSSGSSAAAAGSPDIVAGPEGVVVLEGTRVATGNDHGTGCSLSAAICANLARGATPMAAIVAAKEFVRQGLEGGAAWRLGSGHGPIDHFGWSSPGDEGRAPGAWRAAGPSPSP